MTPHYLCRVLLIRRKQVLLSPKEREILGVAYWGLPLGISTTWGGCNFRVAREGIPESYHSSKDLERRGESHVDILGKSISPRWKRKCKALRNMTDILRGKKKPLCWWERSERQMDDTGERVPGVSSLSEQEEFSAEVKGLVFVTSTEKWFKVKGLEEEHMGKCR